mmetsp:Transcript_91794/g.283897  ORF Transcript_91794/g.283897 Transcript_91794/m.283897 type:complete len:468 (+) Transcript_91794:1084-2487(+)
MHGFEALPTAPAATEEDLGLRAAQSNVCPLRPAEEVSATVAVAAVVVAGRLRSYVPTAMLPSAGGGHSAAKPAHGAQAPRALHGHHVELAQLGHQRPVLVRLAEDPRLDDELPPGILELIPVAPAVREHVAARVRAPEAEAVAAAVVVLVGQVQDLHWEHAREAIKLAVHVGLPEVAVGGRGGVRERAQVLQDAHHAGTGLQMPHVCLATCHRHVLVAALEDCPEAPRLDGVANRRACAVVLAGVDHFRLDVRLLERAPNHHLLRGSVGRRQAGAAAVLVDVAAAVARQALLDDVQLVADLGEEATATLAPVVAVGRLVKGLASAPGTQHTSAAEADERPGVDDVLQAHGQGGGDTLVVVTPEVGMAHVCGHQGGRTCRVHTAGWPRQVEGMAEPVDAEHLHGSALDPSGGVLLIVVERIPLDADLPEASVDLLACAVLLDADHGEELRCELQQDALNAGDVLCNLA